MNSLLVFSHLRWNFVYQRPQHVLSRLAARWPVIYIEEPVPGAPSDRIEFIEAAPGVQVWRPHLRAPEHGIHPATRETMQRLIARALRERGITSYGAWLYTPMALPLLDALDPMCVVYDCMDELSMFKGAPPELLEQESALFRRADLVFTGGRSLYAAKRDRHRNIHCFPSSVDARHFRAGVADHPLQSHLSRPRLGYCGVIDERIDIDLIAGIAAARPEWRIVMVGPTAKIDPASLPTHTNIYWLGQQAYESLPAFINGWDVCLLPFALNDSTRFISPTKTLEYMACGKPCVSTAIRDVVEPYGHVVPIEDDAAGFVHACETFLRQSAGARREHDAAVEAIISRTSWDATAEAMGELIAALPLGGQAPAHDARANGTLAAHATAAQALAVS